MNLEDVAYLEDGDITPDGKLKINDNGKPVVIMLAGGFCGYCHKFAPEFQKVAKKMNGKKANMAIIMIDKEKKLGKELNNYIPNFRGVPHVVVFKGGKYWKTYNGPRKSEDLIEFINGL
jgi:thiol-disulfide isomerase/thioredoxin